MHVCMHVCMYVCIHIYIDIISSSWPIWAGEGILYIYTFVPGRLHGQHGVSKRKQHEDVKPTGDFKWGSNNGNYKKGKEKENAKKTCESKNWIYS